MKLFTNARLIVPLVLTICLTALAADRAKERKDATSKQIADSNESKTFSSFDPPQKGESGDLLAPGMIKFDSADSMQVFAIYQSLSHRTVIYSGKLPAAKITVQNETPLTRREALQLLDTALAQQGITMILLGTKFVKATPAAQAATEAGPVIELPADQLPESSSYLTYVVELKWASPREIAPAIAPLANMPGNGIMAIDSSGLIIIRDYSANVRRMLQLIEKLDKAPGAPGK